MEKKKERACRYSLVVETISGKHYCYDAKNDQLFRIFSDDEEIRFPLPVLDYVTCHYYNAQDFASVYGIEEPVRYAYIEYKFTYKGRKYKNEEYIDDLHESYASEEETEEEKKKISKFLAPAFNNKVWAHVAESFTSDVVDFSDSTNLDALNDIYLELTDVNSSFSDLFLDYKNKNVRISQKLREELRCLVAHERASKNKDEHGVYNDLYTKYMVDKVYLDDKNGFYQDLRKRLSNYREFRSMYLHYCQFKNNYYEVGYSKREHNVKRKALAPQQTSLFD